MEIGWSFYLCFSYDFSYVKGKGEGGWFDYINEIVY